jgi:uncharacterized protein YcaQ
MPAQPAALELDWDQVLGWRLRRHHLDERASADQALAVAAEIAGLHAQIISSAELTLWARVDGLGREAVGEALWRDRTLVKTWAMRGTLHLLPAAEFPLWQDAPSDGQLVRFTRPDQWLAVWRGDQDPDAALLETARRYVHACGAVTREDYARWWGVMAPEGGRVLKRLGDELLPVRFGGTSGWVLAADAGGIAGASAGGSVRLLPAFDQYVVTATRHAEQLMPGPFKDRVYRPQGWLSPVLLAGGRMLGTWRQASRGRRLQVTIEPFTKVPAGVRRQAGNEAERLAAWSATPLDLVWADPA